MSKQSPIVKNDKVQIQPTNIEQHVLTLKTVKFPPASVVVTKLYECKDCEKKFEQSEFTQSNFLKCQSCSCIAKKGSYIFSNTLKLIFEKVENMVAMVYPQQV